MLKYILILCFTVGALAQYQVTDEHKKQLHDILAKQCQKNGAGEDSTKAIETGVHTFVECVKGLIDPTTLQQEIEEAKPKGALDEVFKKYCDKSPQFKTCIHTFLSVVEPCMDAEIKGHFPQATNATDNLIDFVCHKDGDRIALFIAEDGPQCFKDKANAVRECANTVRSSVPNTIEEVKAVSFKDRCDKAHQLSTCIVTALEGCPNPTPANMIEALFRFIRKGSPCKDIKV